MNDFRLESSKLTSDFIKISNSLFENSSQEMKNAFKELNHQFLSHEEACISFQIKATSDNEIKEGLFSLFKKKKVQTSNKIFVDAFDVLSSKIQEISSEWYDQLDAPTAEMITYDYILNFIETNRKNAGLYKNKITKKT